MKIVYVTWRFGQVTNDVYHCASYKHEGDILRMNDVDMQPDEGETDVRPPAVVPFAKEVAMTVVLNDSYVVYDCDGSCTLHN